MRRACESAGDPREALWRAVLAYENCPMQTTSGLSFSYTFKPNRRGEKGNEILVSRKEKTIARSSVEVALARVAELAQGHYPVRLATPKALGVFGASYIYPLFIRLGLVEHIGGCHRGGRRKKPRDK